MAQSPAASAIVNGNRTYHLGLSKQTMKLSRYRASGSTHRKGMTATSWQILFVVASKSTDAQAGSATQRTGESHSGRRGGSARVSMLAGAAAEKLASSPLPSPPEEERERAASLTALDSALLTSDFLSSEVLSMKE